MGIKSIKVLLVEDNPADQLLAREIIFAAYPEALISVVDDGEKAIDAVEHCSEPDSPDIIFLDLNLPRINGHEVLERIKRINPQTQVIVFTGSTSEKDIAKARKFDIVDYIIKPIGMKELEATILQVRAHIELIFS
jgi:CheY-like chemotaxis protein